MKIDEGPAFGAILIGGGVGFLVWQKYHNFGLALAVGLGLTIADYIFVVALKNMFKK